jgi:aryl-alcohol dehydrogenase-like predicted oxidoreductase
VSLAVPVRAVPGESAPYWLPSCTGPWAAGPTRGKLSALNIRRACDASLRRLRTDYIDLYQMHHIDRDSPPPNLQTNKESG